VSHFYRLLAFVTVALLATESLSRAQGIEVPPREPQGLFGGIRPNERASRRLDLSASLIAGYDDDVPDELRPALDSSNQQSGGFSGTVDARGTFTWRNPRTEFGASVSSMFRRAETGQLQGVAGYSAGAGFSRQLPGRFNLSLNQSATYSPTYMYGLFPVDASTAPGAAPSTSLDYAVGRFESYDHVTMVSLRRDFTRRNSFTAIGEYQFTDRLHETAFWNDITSYVARGEYVHNLARNTALTGRARYRTGDYGYVGTGTTTEVGVDFGVDYTRPLSASKRTTVRFNAGATRVEFPRVVTGFERRIRGSGELGFDYQFSRTWQARANLRRGVEYLLDLPTPVFADGVSAGADGLLSRRVDVSMFLGYSDGASVDNRDSLQISTYTGNFRGRYALSRSVAVYLEYLRYYYHFRGSAPVLAGIPQRWDRSGVRAGLTLWVPTLGR
jgi:hypothetical protein